MPHFVDCGLLLLNEEEDQEIQIFFSPASTPLIPPNQPYVEVQPKSNNVQTEEAP
jgi:hypothetical protein